MSTLFAASGSAFCRRSASGILASCVLATAAHAAPLLRCEIDQGGSTMVRDFSPVADPYSVAALEINGRFRFKAVVIGDAQHIEYIKLYVYSKNRRQPVLLHEASYLTPMASQDTRPSALTGVNYIYSPQLERELKYGCAIVEATP